MSKDLNKGYNQSFWASMVDIDDAVVQGNVDKFKMSETGERARIAFPLINPKTGKPAVKPVWVFKYNSKTSWANFQAPADKDSKAYKTAVMHAGEPQLVYVTPILVYATNAKGRVISPDEYSLTTLTLTKQRMADLKSIQEQYDLSEHDILAECKESKYQNISFMNLQDSGLHGGAINQKTNSGEVKTLKMQLDKDAIFEEAIELMETADLAVGSRWSDEQIIGFFKKIDGDGGSEDEFEEDEDFDEEEDEPKKPKKPNKNAPEAPAKKQAERKQAASDYDDIVDDDDEDF